jgi:hypothetical protein
LKNKVQSTARQSCSNSARAAAELGPGSLSGEPLSRRCVHCTGGVRRTTARRTARSRRCHTHTHKLALIPCGIKAGILRRG